MVFAITEQNITQTATNMGPLIVDFWAPWCGPCKMFMPIFEATANAYESQGIRFAKINIDEQPALAKKFGIRSVPTIAVVKGGNIVKLHTGALSGGILAQLIRDFA